MFQCRAGVVEQTISYRLPASANHLQRVTNPIIANRLKEEMS